MVAKRRGRLDTPTMHDMRGVEIYFDMTTPTNTKVIQLPTTNMISRVDAKM
jgi:hypothetical protein